MTWSSRLAEAEAAAVDMGLDVRGREDFCLTETLGKKVSKIFDRYYGDLFVSLLYRIHSLLHLYDIYFLL